MASCGFPAFFFGDNGQCRPSWFYPRTLRYHYDGKGAGAEYSPDRRGDDSELTCIGEHPRHGGPEGGTVPASLLLISATGAPRPALLRALDRDGLSVRRGAFPQSVVTVDDADVVVIDATDSVAAGIDTLVSVRRQSGVPVVFVAGADAGPQAVQALDLGADDFVIEPFVHGEVPARIRSVLRRCRRPGRPAPLTFGRLSVFLAEREVRVDGRLIEMTPLEFDLLARLVAAPRRVFSRTELLEQVWGSSGAWQSPATVTEHIRRLRLKLEADRDRPRWLRTVRGVGYRFDP
jgi:two-component system phosphate regulon response regulator PhoB